MAEGFKAGSIFVELSSRADQINASIAQATAALGNFAASFQSQAAKVAQSSTAVTESIKSITNAVVQASDVLASGGLFGAAEAPLDELRALREGGLFDEKSVGGLVGTQAAQAQAAAIDSITRSVTRLQAASSGGLFGPGATGIISSQAGAIEAASRSFARFGTAARAAQASGATFVRGFRSISSALVRVTSLTAVFAGTATEAFGKASKGLIALLNISGLIGTALALGFGPIGALVAGVVGLGAAIIGLTGPTEEERERIEALRAEIDGLTKSVDASVQQFEAFFTAVGERRRIGRELGLDILQIDLENAEEGFNRTRAEIASLSDQLRVARGTLDRARLGGGEQFEAAQRQVDRLTERIEILRASLPGLKSQFDDLKLREAAREQFGSMREAIEKTNLEIASLQFLLDSGVIGPLEAAQRRSNLAASAIGAVSEEFARLTAVVGEGAALQRFLAFGIDVQGLQRAAEESRGLLAAQQDLERQRAEAAQAAERDERARLEVLSQLDDRVEAIRGAVEEEVRSSRAGLETDQLRVRLDARRAELQRILATGKADENAVAKALAEINRAEVLIREDLAEAAVRAVEARGRELSAAEDQATAVQRVDAFQRQLLEGLVLTEEQARRVAEALDGLRAEALAEDVRKANEELDRFLESLDQQTDAGREASQIERVRLEAAKQTAELQKIAASGLADAAKVQQAQDQIDASRERRIQRIVDGISEEVRQRGEALRIQREGQDAEQEFARFRAEIEARFAGEPIPAKVRLELDAASEQASKTAFSDSFARPFSQILGGAVRGAILEGRDAMQSLADFGRGLFENFIGDATKRLQDGVTAALTNAVGAGGAALATGLTAALGAVGLLLSRGRNQATQTFAGVGGAIQSVQASRGIVAGPQSVAVATLGSDLQRAQAPVVVRLDRMVQLLTIIAGQGGRGSPNLSFAGNVPTQ